MVYFLRYNAGFVGMPKGTPGGRWELLREDNEAGTWTEGPSPRYFNTLVEDGKFREITLEWILR